MKTKLFSPLLTAANNIVKTRRPLTKRAKEYDAFINWLDTSNKDVKKIKLPKVKKVEELEFSVGMSLGGDESARDGFFQPVPRRERGWLFWNGPAGCVYAMYILCTFYVHPRYILCTSYDPRVCGAVARARGNLSEAARLLGLTRPQLAYRQKRQHASDTSEPPVAPQRHQGDR
jgi:hypothetical protein